MSRVPAVPIGRSQAVIAATSLAIALLAFVPLPQSFAQAPATPGINAATTPKDRLGTPWWAERHAKVLVAVREHPDTQLLMIGDSITNNYDKSNPPDEDFQPIWQQFYAPRKALNLGFSGDSTGHVLWRLQHGEVDGLKPKLAVLLIGTNNTNYPDQDGEQAKSGIDAVVAEIKLRLPQTRILLLGLLPSDVSEVKTRRDRIVNGLLAATYANDRRVTYLDISSVFLKAGALDNDAFYDARLTPPRKPLHPDTHGQRRMAEAIEPTVARLMRDRSRVGDARPPPTPQLSTIDLVWSGHRVGFALAVTNQQILVAYYDAERQLTVASRARAAGEWTYQKLDSRTGWDSHNYLAMAVDGAGQIHVAGNMHRDPLVYFRTTTPGDVHTFVRVPVMVDQAREQRMTYPVFIENQGQLVFKYRDGGSGNGNEIYSVFDAPAQRWSRLLATPLFDGEGQRNAYPVGPTSGPDGRFHLAWVWRETPDAETNHDLCYARSRDLVHWERSDGTPLTLPITLSSSEVVDPVPVGGGMINNNTVLGFDNDSRPVITFHKFDAQGNTQIYVARQERARWNIARISDWKNFRWDFRGGGSLDSRLFVSGAMPAGNKMISVNVVRDGLPIEFLLNSRTLKRVSETPAMTLAGKLKSLLEIPPEMQLNTVTDNGSGYSLAWPTLPPNRDQPRAQIPAPTALTLVTPASVH